MAVDLVQVTFPNLDAFSYSLWTEEEWWDQEPVYQGRRARKVLRQSSSGCLAVWKSDDTGSEIFIEKVCCDLAQIVGVSVPPACLGRFPDGTPAIISKKPSPNARDMKLVRGDKRLPFKDPKRLAMYSPKYDCGTVAFDLWVDNWDKHEGNVLLDPSQPRLWSVDYGWSLGFGYNVPYRWGGMQAFEPLAAEPALPFPTFFDRSAENKAKMIEIAQRISGLHSDLIKYVIDRALVGQPAGDLISRIAKDAETALIARRTLVEQWLKTRIS